MGNGKLENGCGRLGAIFVLIDVRRADVRRETVHLRRAAFCDICAVAMGYGP